MPKIDRLFAFVAEDNGPDDEGIMGMRIPGTGEWMPLIGADIARVESLRPIAENISRLTGKPHKVLVFETRREIPTEEPCPSSK